MRFVGEMLAKIERSCARCDPYLRSCSCPRLAGGGGFVALPNGPCSKACASRAHVYITSSSRRSTLEAFRARRWQERARGPSNWCGGNDQLTASQGCHERFPFLYASDIPCGKGHADEKSSSKVEMTCSSGAAASDAHTRIAVMVSCQKVASSAIVASFHLRICALSESSCSQPRLPS